MSPFIELHYSQKTNFPPPRQDVVDRGNGGYQLNTYLLYLMVIKNQTFKIILVKKDRILTKIDCEFYTYLIKLFLI